MMIFYTLEIVYSIPNLTPKHNPHRKLHFYFVKNIIQFDSQAVFLMGTSQRMFYQDHTHKHTLTELRMLPWSLL